jgi:hypothetical protein
LAKRIKDFHIQFLIFFTRKMAPSDLEFIDTFLRRDVTIPAIASEIVATILGVNVPCNLLNELRLARPLSEDLLTIIWKLLEKRDMRISNAYREVSHDKQSYSAYKESFFASSGFFAALAVNPESDTVVTEFFPTR